MLVELSCASLHSRVRRLYAEKPVPVPVLSRLLTLENSLSY